MSYCPKKKLTQLANLLYSLVTQRKQKYLKAIYTHRGFPQNVFAYIHIEYCHLNCEYILGVETLPIYIQNNIKKHNKLKT